MKDDFKFIARIYDRIIRPKDEISWQKLICQSNTGTRLLDVGGGTGRIAETINDCFEMIVIYDASVPMLQKAKSKKFNPVRVCGECENLAFAKNYFDVIIMVDTLHHVINHQQAILSILKVLKRGGIFVLEEPDIRKFPIKIIAIMEKLMLMRSHFLKPEEIIQWIDKGMFTSKFFEEDNNFYFVIEKM